MTATYFADAEIRASPASKTELSSAKFEQEIALPSGSPAVALPPPPIVIKVRLF
jgi:hypothetical protein